MAWSRQDLIDKPVLDKPDPEEPQQPVWVTAPRSRPLATAALPSVAELAAIAEQLAGRLVARHAADEFHAHIADRLFDEMLHEARLALATAADEQAAVDDRIVDQGRTEWLGLRAHALALAVEVDRLRRLRDLHHERTTGLPANPDLVPSGDRP